jgi:hypothetical protein
VQGAPPIDKENFIMSLPEIAGNVTREFEDIVQSHVKSHQHDKRLKTGALFLLGLIPYSEISNFPVAASLVLLGLALYGGMVWFAKPDLSLHVSGEEIEQLTDGARTVFSRLMRTHWDQGVTLSDLDSIVRTSSQKHRAAMKVRQRAESNRRAREQQENALHARREQKDLR